jgi:hypothetical protein
VQKLTNLRPGQNQIDQFIEMPQSVADIQGLEITQLATADQHGFQKGLCPFLAFSGCAQLVNKTLPMPVHTHNSNNNNSTMIER